MSSMYNFTGEQVGASDWGGRPASLSYVATVFRIPDNSLYITGLIAKATFYEV